MIQNMSYVAMTRHRYNVHVFGSSLDFWRPEKLPEALSKSGEKLSAGDYLNADSFNKLMQRDDRLLTKIFERVSNKLDAMGAVSKRAFWQVADDIFSSIGEPYNSPASSAIERRYGKKGHIAVNLKTGAWIDHKDSERSGGPLHMLTKLKGFGFKEAVEYGASWAGLSPMGQE